MATSKTANAQTKSVMDSCEKCGSMMRESMLAIRNSKTFIKILQCKVCRHWVKKE